jgi:hypothetical protein
MTIVLCHESVPLQAYLIIVTTRVRRENTDWDVRESVAPKDVDLIKREYMSKLA